MGITPSCHLFLEGDCVSNRLSEPGDSTFEHRKVNPTSLTGRCSFIKSLHQKTIAVFARTHIGEWNSHDLRTSSLLSREFHQSASRLEYRIVGCFVTLWTKTGHSQPD